MARRRRKEYDDIHNYVERIEDVLLSESSWSTSDSDCSGCLHLSKETVNESNTDEKLELTTLNSSGINRKKNSFFSKTLPLNKGKSGETNSIFIGALSASGVRCSSPTYANDHCTESKMLQPLSLLTAGAQPWNYNICTSHKQRFAYAATLVIYVYQVDDSGHEWDLFSVLAQHRKTITCINWHPTDDDLLASSAMDQYICVWSVIQQCVLKAISICKPPMLVAWCFGHSDLLSFCTYTGPVEIWDYTNDKKPTPYRNDLSCNMGISTYAWHPAVPGRLIIGHHDGRLTLFREDITKVRYCTSVEGLPDNEKYPTTIVALSWDISSPDYLLIAFRGSHLWMVDVTSFEIITKFNVPISSSIACLAWLPDAPGMFITGDSEKGVLRIWSVSRTSPLENCFLKDTGFHVFAVCKEGESKRYSVYRERDSYLDKKGPVLPSVPILTLFKDGGIGMYHLKRKEWIFNREHGHTETIFDCCFKPEDNDLLATGSFDGSIKIWRIDTMETVQTLPNRNVIIYSLSWAPADLNCICAGTSQGEVFIWDIAKGKVIMEHKLHKDKKVFCVSWNRNDSRKIASVGESGFCYVTNISGQLIQEYKHGSPVYGCDWRDDSVLATGCEDGRIRIFKVTKNSKDPLLDLRAHRQKVFRVKWNPLYDDVFCSGSDDFSIKIWSFSRGQCLAVLIGHQDFVRGLVWCPEVPFILVSGSWDKTIKVWDVRSCTCLDTASDHRADVYGLSIHPIRPMLLASCSRDSTVRLWSLTALVESLQLKVLVGRPINEVIGDKEQLGLCLQSSTDSNMALEENMKLWGLRADHLNNVVENIDPCQRSNRILRLLADLFCADVFVRNLWDLVCVLEGMNDISALSPQYATSVVHHSHFKKCVMSSASEKELRLGYSSPLSRTLDEEEELSQLYLSCGALQQYCELMIKLQKWDHALAIAPAISVDYWRQCLERHANELIAEDNVTCTPYLMALRDTEKLIGFHTRRGCLDKALTSCMTVDLPFRAHSRRASAAVPPAIPPRNLKLSLANAEDLHSAPSGPLLECAYKVAQRQLTKTSPILAACTLLSVDDVHGALKILMRGHEIDLVIIVARLLKETAAYEQKKEKNYILINTATRYLIYRAIRLSLWDLAIELANMFHENDEQQCLKAEILLSFNGSDEEKIDLHTLAGVPSVADCTAQSPSTDFEIIFFRLLSSNPGKGIERAIDILKEALLEKSLGYHCLWRILRMVQAIDLSSPNGAAACLKTESKAILLTLFAFYGAIHASYLRYSTVVRPLLEHARSLLEKYSLPQIEFLRPQITEAFMRYEEGDLTLGFDMGSLIEEWPDVGLTKVSGSHLPRHSDHHLSCLTHQLIKGRGFLLEDGISLVALNDALMWAKVNPFSPLGTGHKLNPF